jgi:hypothetical protein
MGLLSSLAFLAGCDCGDPVESVFLGGLGTVTSSVGVGRETHFSGQVVSQAETRDQFAAARAAYTDPGQETKFGIEVPESGTQNGLRIELAFPLAVGDAVSFGAGVFSPAGANAPSIQYVYPRSIEENGRTRHVLWVVDPTNATALVVKTSPLTLDLEADFEDGTRISGALEMSYESVDVVCD